MKKIEAYVRAERVDEVLNALGERGVVNSTLTHVFAVGSNIDPAAGKASMEFGRHVNRMVKLELICPDKDESRLVEAVRGAACTDQPGDGVITVRNVNRLIKIRNAAESTDAL